MANDGIKPEVKVYLNFYILSLESPSQSVFDSKDKKRTKKKGLFGGFGNFSKHDISG